MPGLALVATLLQLPTGVEFTPSPEHASVSYYTAYLLIGESRVRSLNIGKPEPDANGLIRLSTPELYAGLEPGSYALMLTATNDAGESAESNHDPLTIEAPPPPPKPETVCYFEGTAYPLGTVVARQTNRQNMQALIESFWGWVWDDIRQLRQNQYVLTFACR